jgi:UDP-glucose:(glucosyl)LPS alpha-1,2-glucosyltransferase
MVDIIRGEIVKSDITSRARGGTELMAEGMVKHLDLDLLSKVHIIHSRIRNLDNDLPKILVCHDLAQDPEVEKLADPEYRKQFAKIVFVSNWQLQQYNMISGIPYRETAVLHNAIDPINVTKKDYNGTINLIFSTTPHRGLAILVPVFERLLEVVPNIHLHVYSSFSIYGWKERDAQYEELFQRCRDNPHITYHGAVPNEEVREALKDTHIFAYPSIWPETSCIAAIEAMSAGNIVVAPNYAALPETVSKYGVMYGWSEDPNEHAQRFANELMSTINLLRSGNNLDPMIQHQMAFYRSFYSWEQRKHEWNGLLKQVIDKNAKSV